MPKFETARRTARLAMAVGALTLAPHAAAAAAPAPVVKTAAGMVQGATRDAVVEYLGIPYAAPPTGDLRWRPPVQPAPWQGVRPATAFGPSCAQVTMLGVFAGPPSDAEDCLYLNVIAPKNAARGRKLPVLFWIHGGGFVDGAARDYDASKLATQGNVIVVSINYRLSLLGTFAHPALAKEGPLSANYGLLDQQFALRWVKDNIAAFGGDPGNVTVAGQSAGAASAAYAIFSPLARGLAHRAILQSSASFTTATPLAVAQKKAIAFAEAAGCGSGEDESVAACLRRLPADRLIKLSGPTESFGPYVTWLVADGRIITGGGSSIIASGDFAKVPVMIGSTRDEGSFFAALPVYYSRKAITQGDVEGYVKAVFGGNAGPGGTLPAYPAGTVDRILARYPAQDYTSAQLRMNALQSDVMVCRIQHGTRLFAQKVPVYAYEFRDRTAPPMFPPLPDFVSQAYHTADLQYLFPGFHGGDKGERHTLNAQQEKLSDELVAAWTNFARTGDPNGRGVTKWPRYSAAPGAKSYLVQDIPRLSTITDAQQTADHKCDFWADLLVYN